MRSTGNFKLIDELKRSGFTEGGIVEIVLVTRNDDGLLNATPMGVKLIDGYFELKSYRGNKTFENMKRGGWATVNVTHDPTLFLETSFKDEIRNQPIIQPDLTLSAADSSIKVELSKEITQSEDWSIFHALPLEIVKKRRHPIVFSRGRSAAIEAIIHATRVKAFRGQGKESVVEDLTRKIDMCREVVHRVSPVDSPERLVMDELGILIRKWRDPS